MQYEDRYRTVSGQVKMITLTNAPAACTHLIFVSLDGRVLGVRLRDEVGPGEPALHLPAHHHLHKLGVGLLLQSSVNLEQETNISVMCCTIKS